MSRLSALAVLFLTACGPDLQAACENYINANNGCYEEAYGAEEIPDGMMLDAATFCAGYDGYKGSEAKDAAELLDCWATEIEAADCSDASTAGTSLSAALAACPAG